MTDQTITIATDFSRYPGGRYRTDGEFSGQRFREDYLVPALKEHHRITVILDGTLGYGSSFLEEAFGGLVREEGFGPDELSRRMVLISSNPALPYTIDRYIQQARALQANRG